MADHSILQPGNLLMVQERERFLARFLRKNGWPTLDSLRAFEAGCSTGYNMRLFVQWGARPEHIAGIDLDPDAVVAARRTPRRSGFTPGVRPRCPTRRHV